MKIDKIKKVMEEINKILLDNELIDWSSAIEEFLSEIEFYPNETKRNILRLYGGMGSFNDIVLYKNGVLLKNENDEFDTIKSHLFELCQD